MIQDITRSLIFTTNFYLDDMFTKKLRKNIEVFPASNSRQWNFTLLACFVNELNGFTAPKKRAFEYDAKKGKRHFQFRHFQNPWKVNIYIEDTIIHVTFSISCIIAQWERKTILCPSTMGYGCKTVLYQRMQQHTYYEIMIQNPRDGTKALYLHTPIIFNSFDDFSDIFYYFVKKMQQTGIPNIEDTSSLQDYADNWIVTRKSTINSLESLKSHINGFLLLNIQKITSKKRLAKITYKPEGGEEGNYYIISGVYISPWAKSLFHDNPGLIQGFLLDTTWKVMSLYVTSIIMGSAFNAGIPLGFAFGNGEDKSLYNLLLSVLQEKIDLQLRTKIIESDQGSALKAVAKDFSMIHLQCLRHLLVSLKFNEVTYLLGNLIKCTTEFEYEKAKNFLEKTFSTITNKKTIALLNATLKKVGLKRNGNIITIEDEERWDSVAMIHRLKYRMPSTTNALESTHGHMNQKTPRNNNFFMSIYRIVQMVMKKSQSIASCVKINYNRAKNATVNYPSTIPLSRLNQEIDYYQSTRDRCFCGENKLLSSILGIDIPCSHRHHLGAVFPDCPTITPVISQQWLSLELKFEILNEERNPVQDNPDYYDKKYCIDQIRRFSHFKNKDKIKAFVESKYHHDGSSFIGKKPISVIQLITEGIFYFTTLRNNEKLKE